MWLICFLSTGTDERNLIGLRSYPIEIQRIIRNNEKYKNKVKQTNMTKVFITNLIIFIIVLFIFGIFIKSNDFKTNFVNILVLGEVLNVFDLVVIDLIWWRNTKRIRFKDIPEKEIYQNPKQHIDSFLRGIIMYL
jgi:undecaprenyl pyrophosphate phosphatase UppP